MHGSWGGVPDRSAATPGKGGARDSGEYRCSLTTQVCIDALPVLDRCVAGERREP
jgi:hypothetical protein